MPQQRIGSTARTLSSTDTDRNPRQTGCPQLVASYDTQEDTLGLFYIPGPTGGSKGVKKFELAKSVLQFIFIGHTGFRFPVGHFPVMSTQAHNLFFNFWE